VNVPDPSAKDIRPSREVQARMKKQASQGKRGEGNELRRKEKRSLLADAWEKDCRR